MEKPVVSIVIPVYNVEKYIVDSIKSVLNQTYENIQIIIVDDGSLDKSIELAKEVLLSQINVDYRIISQNNMGQGEARNSGLLEAKGEWVFFLDSDDIIATNAIESLVDGIVDNSIDLVFSRYRGINSAKEYQEERLPQSKPYVFPRERILYEFLLRNKIVLAPGTLYRREFLKKNGLLFKRIPWSEDQHFIWRTLNKVHNVSYIEQPLYLYLKRPGSIMTATSVNQMIQSYKAINSMILEIEDFPMRHFILPRWIIGTLNAATRVDYSDWKELYLELNAKVAMRRLLFFPEKRVALAAIVALLFPRVYYYARKKYK